MSLTRSRACTRTRFHTPGALARVQLAIDAELAAILADPTLAGAAQYTREASSSLDDPDWDSDRGRRPNAAFAVNFEVEFVTRNGDPYNR